MTKRRKPEPEPESEPVDTGDLLSHVMEDVYVNEACKKHGRSVRLVTHADTDTVELVSCDTEALDRAKARLVSGNYTAQASVLRRPSNAEVAKHLLAHGAAQELELIQAREARTEVNEQARLALTAARLTKKKRGRK